MAEKRKRRNYVLDKHVADAAWLVPGTDAYAKEMERLKRLDSLDDLPRFFEGDIVRCVGEKRTQYTVRGRYSYSYGLVSRSGKKCAREERELRLVKRKK